ncbi:nitrate ABC transporter substrate-binding protein [Photobacterium sp. GB-27]|uniref:CmpA/NrtA family ABC transporter substrate-binding protein n=1 Tax=unclassified Photobacterium TaxID=2628852 RepID=UPI00006AEB06|nr:MULTISPECIES: CmpA/NrtA family ABC transporter substrate-binding protein [unclassified Photobacterium]EAR57191.1 ABC-type nitrate/sulfonate/bicarbonate transport system, periplasmic component [Photobacterium sp. SKA34]PSV30047.1 nitrate ABC transporter substrate-binding protein [Photobacterium sp. GB-72]PSV34001.1 nitrate ABC transporter substrate-binding protein [Photobacterium sp. GB-27]PSV41807.1 nitrate ABC transporter substrate-binding protein [Photobacterium sp. GB-36]PSW71926.1 nitra
MAPKPLFLNRSSGFYFLSWVGNIMAIKGLMQLIKKSYGVSLSALLFGALTVNASPLVLGEPEKEELKLGFIKLTDMAPLAIAYEKGYFEDEGLYVSLEAQANWKVLLDRVIDGELDGAHMLAGQPLGATIGIGTKAPIITAFSMDLNGNAITVSNEVWQQIKPQLPVDENGKVIHPIKAEALKPVLEHYKDTGKPFQMGMVFPVSTHNYELRYWLAAAGINPGFYAPEKGDNSGQREAEILLNVTPPPQMPATMEAGTIQGYSVGEPWNQQAVAKKIGVPIIADNDIWKNNPEKVFGVTESWAKENPNTHIRLVKALIRAAAWLDHNGNENRAEASKILARSEYVGADEKVIANSMTGSFEYEAGDIRPAPDFNVFFRYNATYPYYSDAVWSLTQMRRWGQIPQAKPDSWYIDIAKQVYRPDIYRLAVNALISDGLMKQSDFSDVDNETGFRPPHNHFIDNITYDGRSPNAYLEQFSIGLKGDQQI